LHTCSILILVQRLWLSWAEWSRHFFRVWETPADPGNQADRPIQ